MRTRIATGTRNILTHQVKPQKGPKIVLFTGGTGSRYLAMELRKSTYNSSHIINVSDSGRSSRQLRLMFKMESIGDIRSRLLDLADQKLPGHKEATEVLKYRLPYAGQEQALEAELQAIIDGHHPLMRALAKEQRLTTPFDQIIKSNLAHFQQQKLATGQPFDLRSASIGNLFLTGVYLFYDRSLETAIHFYRQLANVKGNVIPATLGDIHLAAKLANGENLIGQHLITDSPYGPPQALWYMDQESLQANEIVPDITKNAATAIAEADLIVFSMGSFYTSILSTLHIMGMAQVIRNSSAPKIFIANPIADAETPGMSVGTMASEIVRVLQERDSKPGNDYDYLQYILATQYADNTKLPFLPHGADQAPAGAEFMSWSLCQNPGLSGYNSQLLAQILFSFV